MLRRYLSCVLLLVTVAMLASCGYRVHSQADLPFREIAIDPIENRTPDPKVQDKLYQALAEEFMKQGIRVTKTAQHTISGTVHKFTMHILAEKKDVAVEYRINITADFSIRGADGKTRQFKNISSPFMVTTTGSEALEDLLAAKELAQEKAMRDIAMEVVGALVYP